MAKKHKFVQFVSFYSQRASLTLLYTSNTTVKLDKMNWQRGLKPSRQL